MLGKKKEHPPRDKTLWRMLSILNTSIVGNFAENARRGPRVALSYALVVGSTSRSQEAPIGLRSERSQANLGAHDRSARTQFVSHLHSMGVTMSQNLPLCVTDKLFNRR